MQNSPANTAETRQITERPQTAEALYDALRDEIGTCNYYTLPNVELYVAPRFVMRYTDGVRHMAELVGAHWLLDEIQAILPDINVDIYLRRFALVRITRKPHQGGCTIDVLEDDGKPVKIRRVIPQTDFPVGTFEMFIVDNVLHLKSEY